MRLLVLMAASATMLGTAHAAEPDTRKWVKVTRPVVACEAKDDNAPSCKLGLLKPGTILIAGIDEAEEDDPASFLVRKLGTRQIVMLGRGVSMTPAYIRRADWSGGAFMPVPRPSGCAGHANYVAGIECEDGL